MAEDSARNRHSRLLVPRRTKYRQVAIILATSLLAGVMLVMWTRSCSMKKIEEHTGVASHEHSYFPESIADSLLPAVDVTSAQRDPTGMVLAEYSVKYYPLLTFLAYCILASLTVMVIARTVLFGTKFVRRSGFYPSYETLSEFLQRAGGNLDWKLFREGVGDLAAKYPRMVFWKILNEAVQNTTIIRDNGLDAIYSYFGRGVRAEIDDIVPRRLRDFAATASPAVGFAGTLIGLLYIFATVDLSSTPADDPNFAAGFKVALITSLWGLGNLTLATLVDYAIGLLADYRAKGLENRARVLMERLESGLHEHCVDASPKPDKTGNMIVFPAVFSDSIELRIKGK